MNFTKKDEATLRRIARNAKRQNFFPGTHCHFADGGNVIYSDGHRAFSSPVSLDGFRDGNMDFFHNQISESAAKCTVAIDVDMEKLEAFSKGWKAGNKPFVIEHDGERIGVNPKYLMDQLSFCRTRRIYVDPEWFYERGYKGEIYSCNEDRKAITCPVSLWEIKEEKGAAA